MTTECADLREAIASLADGELEDDAVGSRVRAHLAACGACARLHDRLARTRDALRGAPVPLPSPDEWSALLREARRPQVVVFSWRLLAAAVVLAALLPAGLAAVLDRAPPTATRNDVVTASLDMGL